MHLSESAESGRAKRICLFKFVGRSLAKTQPYVVLVLAAEGTEVLVSLASLKVYFLQFYLNLTSDRFVFT